MKKSIRLMGLTALVLTQVSCTSWMVRQECEKVNWYDHSYSVAMQGRRLSGDPLVEKCRKAEFELPEQQMDVGFKSGMSNYCKPEVVYTTGKTGDFFNTDLCDPGQASFLRQKHADGVKAYCAVDNGFMAGSSGKKYQNICPANLEKNFLKEYNRGRRKYLSAVIASSQEEVADLDRKVIALERDRTNLSYQFNMLPRQRDITERVYSASTGTYVEQTRTEDPASSERMRLNSRLNEVTGQISASRDKQEQLRKSISEKQVEMASLEGD